MSKQPNALRLACEISPAGTHSLAYCKEAAAELRRLHAKLLATRSQRRAAFRTITELRDENEAAINENKKLRAWVEDAEKSNRELLEALKELAAEEWRDDDSRTEQSPRSHRQSHRGASMTDTITLPRAVLEQPQVEQPTMTAIAQRKLDDLLTRGYEVSGYSVYHEKKHQHGFVTGAGLVGWWKPDGAEYPQPQVEHEPIGEAYLCDACGCPFDGDAYCPVCGYHTATKEPIYTHPQPPRQPLTDEQKRDAARYRWLRDYHDGPDGIQDELPYIAAGESNEHAWALSGKDADTSIDTAMRAHEIGGEE